MASMAAAARDIPQASLNRDNLTVVADRSDPATVARSHNLPTPPNSISPALPAHGLKAQLQKAAKLEPIDSDLDLHEDAHGPNKRSVSPHHDPAGTITSGMLAAYHLPEILLNHGPLAIRHIIGYLTTSVPGFSGIPPTKARRLVVGALEGRGDGAHRGDNQVDFEKVGWGRWNAKRRGLSGRDHREATPPGSLPNGGIPISRNALRAQERARANAFGSSGESFHFSHDEHAIPMMEDETDKMSMDGYESASCSEAPDDDVAMNDDPEDVTDDEDWAAMGAAALRAESYPNMAAALSSPNMPVPHTYSATGMRAFSGRSGMALLPQSGFDMSALEGASGAQERDAVEALLRLGSV